MLLAAKLRVLAGLIGGAAALIVMNQACKRKRHKKQQETHAPIATSD